jgi:hypothetical protein
MQGVEIEPQEGTSLDNDPALKLHSYGDKNVIRKFSMQEDQGGPYLFNTTLGGGAKFLDIRTSPTDERNGTF